MRALASFATATYPGASPEVVDVTIDLRAPAAAVAKARKRVEQAAAEWPSGYRVVRPR